ncbi:hypothetical protein D8682_26495 [Buttiauxella sp. 3AFRM03]|uniref:hypothetical protein n=1 Tax=Buttiauxella sp. 3AFRM03 TaxID=2479367 RepID=UPI000EF77E9D|nr:hypothetical protein [Buttiauxella sp. 3AFRM03]AYN25723.1 hypothetical protein D8682_01220 [Buttiauxella sp. 3AFRM03]AYN30216.1 hypothetical protein D8682_26495 [Buttiauxella sp. 3AFRM03]
MDKGIEALIADMKAAAEKATPGRIGDRIDGSGSIKYECLGLDKTLVLRTDHKNMEYGFIGDNGDADEVFFRLSSPENVLALIAALEQAQQESKEQSARIEELESQRKLAFMACNRWRDKCVDAEKRIAELEKWQQCEHSKKRNAVIDGLAQCGEAAWEIEEYMQQWDKEHPLELAAYKAELDSAPNGMMQLSNELAEMKRKCAEVPDEFARIGESLRTQSNRTTGHPVFVVFDKQEIVGSEEHDCDRIAWVFECHEVDECKAGRLEALYQGGRDTRGYDRYAMKSIDQFVTACFTEDGCKDYLQQNGHNLNKPFIYVHSAYRNDEWQVIRNWLMTVGGIAEGGE